MYDRKKIAIWILLGACVLLASQPVLAAYLYYGHDLQFHLNRIEGIKESLQAGIFPVRMHYETLGGAGYPVSVFYGDALLYIPALLRILGCSVQLSYQIYIVMINTLTSVIMYKVLKNIFKDEWIGIIGTFIYIMAPYRLECIYLRAAVGEYTALCFYPLIVYALYRIYRDKEDLNKYNWLYLSIGFSGLILSHIISTFCAFVLTAIVCLINFKSTFKKQILCKLIKAVLLTLGICAGFLVPFADYMLSGVMKSDIAASGSYVKHTITLSQLLSVFPHGRGCAYPMPDEIYMDLEMTYAMGGTGTVCLIIYLFCLFYLDSKKDKIDKLGNAVFGFSILVIWMATSYFPWKILERLGGIFIYVMYYIQFPWRFLGAAAVLISFTATALIYKIGSLRNNNIYYGLVISLVVLTYISGNYIMTDYMTLKKMHIVQESDVDRYNIGAGEYLPEGAVTNYEGIIVADEKVTIVLMERDEMVYYVECMNLTRDEQKIQLPIINYKNYHAKDLETGEELAIEQGEECRIKITLPGGYCGKIAVEYSSPWYWRLSEMISGITIVGVLFVFLEGLCRKKEIRFKEREKYVI